MATEQTIWIFQIVQTFPSCLIAAICNKAIRLQQTGRTDKFIWIPPERRARSRAACAQNTLVQAIQLLALGRWLQTFFLRRNRVIDQERLDRMILLEELGHVDDQIANDRQTRQWSQHDRFSQLVQIGGAGQSVLAIDIHCIGTTYTFAAWATQSKGIVHVGFDTLQCIQQHLVGIL